MSCKKNLQETTREVRREGEAVRSSHELMAVVIEAAAGRIFRLETSEGLHLKFWKVMIDDALTCSQVRRWQVKEDYICIYIHDYHIIHVISYLHYRFFFASFSGVLTGDKLQKLHDALEDVDKGTLIRRFDFWWFVQVMKRRVCSRSSCCQSSNFTGKGSQFSRLTSFLPSRPWKNRGGRRMLSLGPVQFKGHEARCVWAVLMVYIWLKELEIWGIWLLCGVYFHKKLCTYIGYSPIVVDKMIWFWFWWTVICS